MTPPPITNDQVIATGCSAVEATITRLRDDSRIAHLRGYSAYSRALSNFALHIEQARDKFIEEVEQS